MGHGIGSDPGRPPGEGVMTPAEKLVCEWEARHDVASRGRRADPAGALSRYLTHARWEELQRHRGPSAHGAASPRPSQTEEWDDFAAEHPLAASWLRWGEKSP